MNATLKHITEWFVSLPQSAPDKIDSVLVLETAAN